MRPHPKASLIFLLIAVGSVIAFPVSMVLWETVSPTQDFEGMFREFVMIFACGFSTILCALISLGLGLHAARTNRWVLIWTIPLTCFAIGAFGGGLILLLGFGHSPRNLWVGITGLVSGGLGIAFFIAALIAIARRTP